MRAPGLSQEAANLFLAFWAMLLITLCSPTGLSSLRGNMAEHTEKTHELFWTGEGGTNSHLWNEELGSENYWTNIKPLTRSIFEKIPGRPLILPKWMLFGSFVFVLMRALTSIHINTKIHHFPYLWSPFHVCFLLLRFRINHSCDTILKHHMDFFS